MRHLLIFKTESRNRMALAKSYEDHRNVAFFGSFGVYWRLRHPMNAGVLSAQV